ncbi:MAG: hypothetical protein PHW72_00645 [Candidatus Pacebacteria bacterium]|nr:hypothetical protein [Candidatus Paceibacterota bacterium]
MQKFLSLEVISLVFGLSVIIFLVSFYAFAWDEPLATPAGNNARAPLNSGFEGQEKEGGLILNTGGAEYGLIVGQGKADLGDSLTLKPSSQPFSPLPGQIYFNSSEEKMYYYNGTKWISFQ